MPPDLPTPPSLPSLEAPSRGEEAAPPVREVPRCANCEAPLSGPYCARCGQAVAPFPEPAFVHAKEALEEAIAFEGRLWRTLGVLLFRPGRLTNAYLAGRRVRYIRPVRLYLAASVLFFFLLTVLDPVGRLETTLDQEATERTGADDTLAVGSMGAADSLSAVEAALAELPEEQAALESLRAALAVLPPDSLLRVAEPRGEQTAVAAEAVPDAADAAEAARVLVEMPAWSEGEAVRALEAAEGWDEQRAILAGLGRDYLGRIPAMMFVMLPLFALLLKLFYGRPDVRRAWTRLQWRRPVTGAKQPGTATGEPPVRYYAEHLVFTLHTHAFAFFVFAVVAALVGFAGGAVWAGQIAGWLMLAVPVYFFLALRAVYGQSWLKTAVKYVLLGWAYVILLTIGMIGAMFATAALA